MSAEEPYGTQTRCRPGERCNLPSKHEPTRIVELFMAGDIEHAKQVIRRLCKERPCCVTVTKTTYIYCGGEESGFIVGLRNYPRFPSDSQSLVAFAVYIGEVLLDAIGQDSFMVSDHSGQTFWTTTRQGG